MLIDDILPEILSYENGCFRLPEGPGLGVETDDDKLAHLERQNEKEGDFIFCGDIRIRSEPRYMGMY